MSFILDALRKSEIERQRQSGPSMAEFAVARTDRRLPVALIAIGFLLAVNLAVVLFFMLRDSPAPAASATPAAAASSATSGAPVATPAPTSGNAPRNPGANAMNSRTRRRRHFGGPATEPPDAPDPTLIPDTPVSGPDVTYGEAPPAPIDSLTAAGVLGTAGAQRRPAYLCGTIRPSAPSSSTVAVTSQGAQHQRGARWSWRSRAKARCSAISGRRFLLPRL